MHQKRRFGTRFRETVITKPVLTQNGAKHRFGIRFRQKVKTKTVLSQKTEALWIGSKRGSSEVLLPHTNFKRPNLKGKSLGVWLSVDPEATATLHQEEKLEKVRNILACWKYRRLISACLCLITSTFKSEGYQRSK